MRLRIDLAYDGTDFSGWAAQPGRRTVEDEIARALATILRLEELPALVVAGRTDAGVHARAAVCHTDVPDAAFAQFGGQSSRSPQEAGLNRLNGVLPQDIVVRQLSVAPAGFDARFSAAWRRYRYLVCDDPARLDPLRRRDVVVHRRPLDVAAMDQAAHLLCGLHDFAAFCKKREGATTVRTLLDYRWQRRDDGLLEARVVADAFCHSMVRSLVGVLVPVGELRRPPEWAAEVMRAGRRDPAVTVMPAHGLRLEEVGYPPADQLADRARQSRARRTL